MNPDLYPSVTIVAGDIKHVPGFTGPLLKMHDGSIYVSGITPAIAQQWIETLEPIAAITGEK